jgi:hypothetical protein
MFSNRWHHRLHWERDLPEELTAGREDVHLRFSYRTRGARPGAISEEAQLEYLRAYRQPGAMRAGFELYRATPRDVADNEAFLAQGGKPRMVHSRALEAPDWGRALRRGRVLGRRRRPAPPRADLTAPARPAIDGG